MVDNQTTVRKRDGTFEPLNYDKIHAMLEFCSDGLNVSISETAIGPGIVSPNNFPLTPIPTLLRKDLI